MLHESQRRKTLAVFKGRELRHQPWQRCYEQKESNGHSDEKHRLALELRQRLGIGASSSQTPDRDE